MDFRVDLNVLRGSDGPAALSGADRGGHPRHPHRDITEQYLAHLAVLEQLDVNAVGDFLALAAWLIEIKSQQVLPRSDEVQEEIKTRGRNWCSGCWNTSSIATRRACWRSGRGRGRTTIRAFSSDLPTTGEIERRSRSARSSRGTWSTPSGGSSARTLRHRPSNIVYDDTPIHVHMERIQRG